VQCVARAHIVCIHQTREGDTNKLPRRIEDRPTAIAWIDRRINLYAEVIGQTADEDARDDAACGGDVVAADGESNGDDL